MGTHYLKTILETSPDRRRYGAWERLGKKKTNFSITHTLMFILGRLYGLMTFLGALSGRGVQIIKAVLFGLW